MYNAQSIKNFFPLMHSFFKTNKNFKNKKGDMISKKKKDHAIQEKTKRQFQTDVKIRNYSKLEQKDKVQNINVMT